MVAGSLDNYIDVSGCQDEDQGFFCGLVTVYLDIEQDPDMLSPWLSQAFQDIYQARHG